MITNQYAYNGDGQRVSIVDSQGTKKPIWDGENILLETDGSNATQAVYTLEPAGYGNLVSQRRGSTTTAFLFDALGSTRKLFNVSSGSVSDSYDYRAYGETFASSGSTINVFRWVGEAGYYYDVDREAYYVRARHYSPQTARFISQDPIGFNGSPWNLFEYVKGNSVERADPSGERFIGPPCGPCLQAYQRCTIGVGAAYASCIGGAGASDFGGLLATELACYYICMAGPVACAACTSGGVIGPGGLFICQWYICDLIPLYGDDDCGNKYNRCTLRNKKNGCSENWRPDK